MLTVLWNKTEFKGSVVSLYYEQYLSVFCLSLMSLVLKKSFIGVNLAIFFWSEFFKNARWDDTVLNEFYVRASVTAVPIFHGLVSTHTGPISTAATAS